MCEDTEQIRSMQNIKLCILLFFRKWDLHKEKTELKFLKEKEKFSGARQVQISKRKRVTDEEKD